AHGTDCPILTGAESLKHFLRLVRVVARKDCACPAVAADTFRNVLGVLFAGAKEQTSAPAFRHRHVFGHSFLDDAFGSFRKLARDIFAAPRADTLQVDLGGSLVTGETRQESLVDKFGKSGL